MERKLKNYIACKKKFPNRCGICHFYRENVVERRTEFSGESYNISMKLGVSFLIQPTEQYHPPILEEVIKVKKECKKYSWSIIEETKVV